jgi:hypothetical protein
MSTSANDSSQQPAAVRQGLRQKPFPTEVQDRIINAMER